MGFSRLKLAYSAPLQKDLMKTSKKSMLIIFTPNAASVKPNENR